ncbi:MAG: hypothetical protein ABIQ40_07250 [Bacteroidia bacterium]
MAITTLRKPNRLLFIGIPALIFFCCYLITLSPSFKNNNQVISLAILGDLVITAPLLYLFFIRKSAVSKITILRIIFIGIIVAGAILNTESNQLIHVLKVWISPVIECTLIFVLVRKFYLANRLAKEQAVVKTDFLNHCRKVLTTILGNKKAADIFSSEIAVFYYAFFGRKEIIDNKNTFSSYKGNGVTIVLGSLLFVFLTEALGSHFLFAHWSTTLAWVITSLSVYTCLQLFAHIRSIKARANKIHTDCLELHMGMAADAYIDFNNIEKIELNKSNFNLKKEKSSCKLSLIGGLESHNVLIELKSPIEVIRMFGIKKQAKIILFYVDEPEKFIDCVVRSQEKLTCCF